MSSLLKLTPAGAVQRHIQGMRAILQPEHRRGEDLLAINEHVKCHGAMACCCTALCVVVVLQSHVRNKAFRRLPQDHRKVLGGIESQAMRVGFVTELVRRASPGFSA